MVTIRHPGGCTATAGQRSDDACLPFHPAPEFTTTRNAAKQGDAEAACALNAIWSDYDTIDLVLFYAATSLPSVQPRRFCPSAIGTTRRWRYFLSTAFGLADGFGAGNGVTPGAGAVELCEQHLPMKGRSRNNSSSELACSFRLCPACWKLNHTQSLQTRS